MATSIGTGASTGTCAPTPATSTANGATRAGATSGRGRVSTSIASATVPTTDPTIVTRPASPMSPSHPAWRAPMTSRATSPRPTTVRASPAIRRPRRAKRWAPPRAPAVRTSRTRVRPPTPSQLHATARNVTAATSRQSAPSVSRILGTEAPVSRGAPRSPRRVASAPDRFGAGYGVASASSDPGAEPAPTVAGAGCCATDACCRKSARSRSARCSVVKSSTAPEPVSGRAQRGQTCGASGREAWQSGQRDGSAYVVMSPSTA